MSLIFYKDNGTEEHIAGLNGQADLVSGKGIVVQNGEVSQTRDQLTFTGTRNEWNSLSVEQKAQYGIANITDDVASGIPIVVDAITDGDLNPVTSNAVAKAVNYSTDEVKTGARWIDGKPIYRKVVDIGTLPSETSKSVNHGISSLGSVIKVYGVATNGVGHLPLPFVSISEANCVLCAVLETTIDITAGVDRSAYSGWIAIEYTKTTD